MSLKGLFPNVNNQQNNQQGSIMLGIHEHKINNKNNLNLESVSNELQYIIMNHFQNGYLFKNSNQIYVGDRIITTLYFIAGQSNTNNNNNNEENESISLSHGGAKSKAKKAK